MKAVVLHEYGGPEKLKFEDNVPDPQISGDTVLIAAAAASVNPIDWKMRSGARQKDFRCRSSLQSSTTARRSQRCLWLSKIVFPIAKWTTCGQLVLSLRVPSQS